MTVGISHCLLRLIAHFVLEPRFRSGKWRIRPQTLERMKPAADRLGRAYEAARILFHEKIRMCRNCDAGCCAGANSRFSVYDHITHLVTGIPNPLTWGYNLCLLGSYRRNRIDEGWCPNFVEGKGCGLEYPRRPAICVWWVCSRMNAELDKDAMARIKEIRRAIDKVQWAYARYLLFGGMRRN